MTAETFLPHALALKARADGASTNDERAQIIAAIHQLVRSVPISFDLATCAALFGLVDKLTAQLNNKAVNVSAKQVANV